MTGDFEDSSWIKKPITDLLLHHGLATAEGNQGLTLERTELGGYRARLQAHLNAYHIVDEFSTRAIFGAHSEGGAVRIVNFVISDMPFLKNQWRKLLRERPAGVVKTLADLDDFLAYVASELDKQVLEYGLAPGIGSRIALMNLYVARGTNRLEDYSVPGKVPSEPVRWVKAGVPVQYVLHFFSNASDGGYNHQLGKPVLSMEEALDLTGIGLRQVKILYPPVYR